jgi:hypothetical protein
MSISAAQIKVIHSLKGKAGLDDRDYRAELGRFGAGSSKDLSASAAIGFIDRLRTLAGDGQGPRETTSKRARGALELSGPYAGICRALWISGWNLGVFEAREDTALVAFVRRQTGIDHLNWVRDPADARKVIEGLKKWLAREAGVDWPRGRATEAYTRKWAVVRAQLRLLGRFNTIPADRDLDDQMAELGVEIRKLKARLRHVSERKNGEHQ